MLRFNLLILAVVSALTALAGEPLTARKVFAEAPLEMIDMIRPTSRLDMLDWYSQADSIFAAPDALGGKSRIETMTDDYIRVKVSPVSTLEIKILPYKKDFIAMSLYTVGGDSIATDTEVAFYDAALKPLPAGKFFKAPDPMSFFNIKDSDISEAELREWMPFQTVELTTGPGDTPLKASVTILAALPQEVREKLRDVLLPSMSASWTGSGFRFRR